MLWIVVDKLIDAALCKRFDSPRLNEIKRPVISKELLHPDSHSSFGRFDFGPSFAVVTRQQSIPDVADRRHALSTPVSGRPAISLNCKRRTACSSASASTSSGLSIAASFSSRALVTSSQAFARGAPNLCSVRKTIATTITSRTQQSSLRGRAGCGSSDFPLPRLAGSFMIAPISANHSSNHLFKYCSMHRLN